MGRQVGRAGPLGDQLVPRAVQLPADRVADDQHPLGAVEGGAVLVAFLHVGRPDPLLEDELLPCPRLPSPGYSKTAYCVSGNCWSSSKKYLPPRQATRARDASSTPRPQQATSMSWTPSLPMSPVPKSYHQRQMPGSRFGWYGTIGAGPTQRSKSRSGGGVARLRLADRCRGAGCSTPWRRARRRSRPSADPLDRFADVGRAAALRADLHDACRVRAPPRPSAGLRGCCGSRASRRRRACRRRRPGSRPGRASGRAWRSRRRRPPGRRGPGAGPSTAFGAFPDPEATTSAPSASRRCDRRRRHTRPRRPCGPPGGGGAPSPSPPRRSVPRPIASPRSPSSGRHRGPGRPAPVRRP